MSASPSSFALRVSVCWKFGPFFVISKPVRRSLNGIGGLIGMVLAAYPESPIRRLVLNDVGPQLAAAAIERIRSYAGSPPAFATVSELEGALAGAERAAQTEREQHVA